MQLSNLPGKLVLPFANAGGKSTIPVASQIGITAGAASLTDGFPPLTRTPIAAGGVPPSGLDMNGILFEMSAIIRWANAGGGYPFDGTFATDTNVGGYPKGARIMRSDGQGYWFNTAENNVTDPESAGAAAAGWVPDYQSGATSVAMSGSSVTLTPAQYGKPVIVITGAITANLNLIFPNIVGQWTVINSTTGGYVITGKTSAGTGVALGTVSSVVGDGTNIYSTKADLANSSDMHQGVALIGGAGRVVDSVATLRTLPNTGTSRAFLTGYYAPGDGGGGEYWLDLSDTTSADNGGTIIVAADGGRWKLIIRTFLSVKQFGAKGNSTNNDKSAIETAAGVAATLGITLYAPCGTYYSPTGFLFQVSNLHFVGGGMPRVSSDLHSLVGGTILQGTVLFDGDNVTVESMGADHGIAYSDAHTGGAGGDGLVVHNVGLTTIRLNNNVFNCVGLTRIGNNSDPQAAFHAMLIEGIQFGSADNVMGVGGWFGVVFKVTDFNIGHVIGRENDAISVHIKSNTYAPVTRVNIDKVTVSNYVSRGYVGFGVVASDAELATVTVGQVSVNGGMNAVRILGEVTQPCVGVAIGQISTRNGTSGLSVVGPCYGVTADSVVAWQPSGTCFSTEANTGGTHPADVTIGTLRACPSVTTTNSVNIGSSGTKVVIGTVNAAGASNSLIAGSVINVTSTTEIGQCFGTLKSGGNGATLLNGWAPAFAGQAVGIVVKSGFTQGYGRISASAATGEIFMNIPSGLIPNNLEFYTSMTGYDGGTGRLIPVTVLISAAGNLTLVPNKAAYSTVAWFNITDLKIPTRIPTEGGM